MWILSQLLTHLILPLALWFSPWILQLHRPTAPYLCLTLHPPKSWSARRTSVQLSWKCLPALLLGWLMTLLMLPRACSLVNFLKSTVCLACACWRQGKPRPQLGHHLQTGFRSFESTIVTGSPHWISCHVILMLSKSMTAVGKDLQR